VRQRQVFTPLENLSYDAGRRFIDGGQKALEDIQTTTQQITRQAWENRPTFEIPQIRMPRVEFPEIQLPEIKLPEIQLETIDIRLPEIPQISLPPRVRILPPPEKPLKEKIREIPTPECGGYYMEGGIVEKVKGYNLDGSLDIEYASILDFVNAFKTAFPDENRNSIDILFAGGGTGQEFSDTTPGFDYRYFESVTQSININGSLGSLEFPFYRAKGLKIQGFSSAVVGNILDILLGFEPTDFYTFRPDKIECIIPPVRPNIEPPPIPRKRKMNCCPEIDYRLIKKFIDDSIAKQYALINENFLNLKNLVGGEEYPVTVPEWLTQSSQNISITNLTQLLIYSIKQLDAFSGEFPIQIEMEDADLLQSGNQKKRISLPNIAETLAEVVGLLMTLRVESDANLSATIRGMIESGSAKQAAIVAGDYARANAEFLAYKGKQKNQKIPMAFTPGKERLDEILKETEISLKTWENDDPQDFTDAIIPILEMAAMWKAQNFQMVKSRTAKADLLKSLQIASELIRNPEQDPDKQDSNWNQFTEEAELGFISQPGISDTANPYGRSTSQRPRIRTIGKKNTNNKQ
ncbi:MAG TPA: hypothetical protein IGR89_07765, partial [Oscillatoriaceae cyanobacterium M7585_C2015_266]|nr:hypothetical protein [Oscillatoriaceae cyanobacterium M7585_C2015_266]